jgi:beta-lactamase class A
LRIIEAQAGGTLGAELLEVNTGRSIGLNQTKRFGHCSSFKTSLAAMVLARDVSGADNAGRRIMWAQSDLLGHSQFTTDRLASGATLLELAEATQKYSDNTAANVLLREVGGPAALTAFWRSIGDDVSRLDRMEPALNNVPLTEIRDTTNAPAMARTVAKLAFGDVLPDAQRELLRRWMADTATGAKRVRAGLPEDWASGDKTGTSLWPGIGSLYVDIGFVESPDRGPFTFAAYFRMRGQSDGIDPAAELVLARVGEVLASFAQNQDVFSF